MYTSHVWNASLCGIFIIPENFAFLIKFNQVKKYVESYQQTISVIFVCGHYAVEAGEGSSEHCTHPNLNGD